MGGRPLTALNLLGVPVDDVPPAVIAQILRGGASKVREAGCALVGGHTIRNPEPIYGLSVTGLVHPKRSAHQRRRPARRPARSHQTAGHGIATTAIKRGIASARAGETRGRADEPAQPRRARPGRTRGWCARRRTSRASGCWGTWRRCAGRAACRRNCTRRCSVPVLDRDVLALIEKDCVPGGTRQNLETARPLMEIADFDAGGARTRSDAVAGRRADQRRPAAVRAAPSAGGGVRRLRTHRTACAAVIGRGRAGGETVDPGARARPGSIRVRRWEGEDNGCRMLGTGAVRNFFSFASWRLCVRFSAAPIDGSSRPA